MVSLACHQCQCPSSCRHLEFFDRSDETRRMQRGRWAFEEGLRANLPAPGHDVDERRKQASPQRFTSAIKSQNTAAWLNAKEMNSHYCSFTYRYIREICGVERRPSLLVMDLLWTDFYVRTHFDVLKREWSCLSGLYDLFILYGSIQLAQCCSGSINDN